MEKFKREFRGEANTYTERKIVGGWISFHSPGLKESTVFIPKAKYEWEVETSERRTGK